MITAWFFEEATREALLMLDSEATQEEILAHLVNAAEQAAGPGCVSSILLLAADGLLHNGASPKLPEDYLRAIDGLKPDARVGTCAAAAATAKMVITPDFCADDKWEELRHLPLSLGFAGAWSMPIKTPEGKVLGTFGTYYREKRAPSEGEIQAVGLLATAAATVITRKTKA